MFTGFHREKSLTITQKAPLFTLSKTHYVQSRNFIENEPPLLLLSTEFLEVTASRRRRHMIKKCRSRCDRRRNDKNARKKIRDTCKVRFFQRCERHLLTYASPTSDKNEETRYRNWKPLVFRITQFARCFYFLKFTAHA